MLDSIGIFHADAQEIYGQLAGSERPTAHLANAADEPGRRKATFRSLFATERLYRTDMLPAGTWNVAETLCVVCYEWLSERTYNQAYKHAKRSGNELKRRSRNAEEILKYR